MSTGKAFSLLVGSLVFGPLAESSAAESVTNSTASGVRVSWSLESGSVVLHAPVRAILQVENHTAQPITVDLGLDRKQNVLLAVRRPGGEKLSIASQPLREGPQSRGIVNVSPGERLVQQILVNEWTRLDKPGVYELEAQLRRPIVAQDGTRIPVAPWHESVQVLPHDAGELRRVCEKLVFEIEGSTSVREATWAASALGHVTDPIAVPYLDRALRSGKYVETPVIDGLVRIGSVEAVNVLRSVVTQNPGWPTDTSTSAGTRANKAAQGLQTIATTSTDPVVRRQAERALPRARRLQD